MQYSSDDLIVEVRRRARLPEDEGNGRSITDQELLEYADQEMLSTVADVLRAVDASFWMTSLSVSLGASTTRVRIPRRAFGVGIESAMLVDSTGLSAPLVQLLSNDAFRYPPGIADTSWPASCAFYMQGDELVLLGNGSAWSGKTLIVRYQMQPSQLVLTTECAGINQDTLTATSASVDYNITTDLPAGLLTTGQAIDAIPGIGTHLPILVDGVVADFDGTSIVTLDTSGNLFDLSTYTRGPLSRTYPDFMCSPGMTPYPQIPQSLWPLLVSATTAAVCESIGDREGFAVASATLEKRIQMARSVTAPRSRETVAIINHDSYLRRGRRW